MSKGNRANLIAWLLIGAALCYMGIYSIVRAAQHTGPGEVAVYVGTGWNRDYVYDRPASESAVKREGYLGGGTLIAAGAFVIATIITVQRRTSASET